MDSHGYIYIYVRTYISLIVSILQQTWIKKSKQATFPLPVAPYARMHTALQGVSGNSGCNQLQAKALGFKTLLYHGICFYSIFWKAIQVTPRRTSLALQRSLKFILNLTEDLQRRSLDEHAYKM